MVSRKFLITTFFVALIFIQIFSFASAESEYENHIFVIDAEGKTTYRYQYTIQITDYGMYLPAFTTELYVPEGINADFFDNYGKISAKKTDNYEGYDVYDVRTKDVEYNEEYGIGFQYVLDDAAVYRYKENYHFSYPIFDETLDYYVCIPDAFYSFPATYDNNPKEPETYNPYYITPITPIEYTPIEAILVNPSGNYYSTMQLVDKCPAGYKEATPDVGYDDYYKVSFDYQNPDYEVPTEEYTGTNMSAKVPAIYKAQISDSLKAIDPILPKISSRLDLDVPSKYNVEFLSTTDKVFDGNFMVSFDDGTAFFGVDAVGQDPEFFQVNLLRGIINTALLKTYGENFGNWWSEGALTIMAMNLMKESGLEYSEVKSMINSTKNEISLYTKEEIDEIMQYGSNDLLIHSSMVDEIETYCPDHIIKLNNNVLGSKKGQFDNERHFNNYLLYIIKSECNIDISNILDKYFIEHDNISEIITLVVNLENSLKQFPLDLLPDNVASQVTQIEKAKTLLEKGQFIESKELIETADAIITPQLVKIESILPKYSQTQSALAEMPVIFYLPVGPLAQGEFSGAKESIKIGEFEKAEAQLNSANFWVSNSASTTILLLIVLIIIVFGFLVKTNNPLAMQLLQKVVPKKEVSHKTKHKKAKKK